MFGIIRHITPESKGWDATLWFALRGAGGNNFGVVTNITFAMEDAPKKTVIFRLQYSTVDDCAHALHTFTQLGSLPADADGGISTLLSGQFQASGLEPEVCTLYGMYMGSVDEFNKTLSTYTARLSANGVYYNTTQTTITEYDDDYLGGLDDIMEQFGGLNDTGTFYLSLYAQGLADNGVYNMTLDSAKAIMYSLVASQPPDRSYLVYPQFSLSGPGSATARPPRYGDMAFTHTTNIFVSQIFALGFPPQYTPAYWEGVGRVTYFVDAMRAVDPTQKYQSYQNYMVCMISLPLPLPLPLLLPYWNSPLPILYRTHIYRTGPLLIMGRMWNVSRK